MGVSSQKLGTAPKILSCLYVDNDFQQSAPPKCTRFPTKKQKCPGSPASLIAPRKSKGTFVSIPVCTNLFLEVLDDGMLRHLGSNNKAPFDLLFYTVQSLLIVCRGETFCSGKIACRGCIQGGYLEKPQGLVNVSIHSKWCQPHLSLRLRNSDNGFQLPVCANKNVETNIRTQLQQTCQHDNSDFINDFYKTYIIRLLILYMYVKPIFHKKICD